MKLKRSMMNSAGILITGSMLASCDWTGGGDGGFNTSQGGASVNISGAYQGVSGGLAVSNTSGAPIGSLTIQQSGNRVDVTDSNGSNYRGAVGSPNTLVPATASSAGVGQQLATFQISWSGRDGVAQKDVEFTGVITLVTVQDIQGRTRNTGSNDTSTSTNSGTDTTTTTATQGRDESQTDSATGNTETDRETTTTTTTDTSTNTDTSTDTDNRTTTTTFTVTRDNVQYNLRGTWLEIGGVSASVDAIAPGAGGTITTVTTGTN